MRRTRVSTIQASICPLPLPMLANPLRTSHSTVAQRRTPWFRYINRFRYTNGSFVTGFRYNRLGFRYRGISKTKHEAPWYLGNSLWCVFLYFWERRCAPRATIPFWELCGRLGRHGTRDGSPVRRKAGGGLDPAADEPHHMLYRHVRSYANLLIILANAIA
jgi:hypothetical protein